jgi:hypothetical protein
MYFCVFYLDFTTPPGAESCRAKTSHGSKGLILIQKEESVKLWCRIRRLLPRRLMSLRRGSRDPLTISAINALPIAGPPLMQEIAREKEKCGTVASGTGMPDGKICPACGGNTKVKILNYWCDPVTDIITPADTIEQCGCGWTGLVVEHERPL